MLQAVYRTYRNLVRRPTFFLAVVLTMALGIGANSAIFSVIDAVLLKPLPYPGADRLVAVFESSARLKVPRGPVAPPRLEEWNRLTQSFAGITGAFTENRAETSGTLPEKLVCARAAPRFFSVLGTPPLVGRGFGPDEETANGPLAAVISERLWKRRFQSDSSVPGRILRLNDRSYPIVGVMPDSFRFPADDVDVWLPAKLAAVVMTQREARFYSAVGRIKEGVSLDAARADLAAVQARLAMDYPATDAKWSAIIDPLKEETVGSVARSLWVLFAAVSLVLLIACGNVACLLLAQASRRDREIAVRFAIGARRRQVVGGLLLEAICAAAPGAMMGLLMAVWGAEWFRHAAARLPRAEEIHLDWRIVLFTLAVTVATALLFGLIPALQATRAEVSGTLAAGSRTQAGGRQRVLRTLVSAQIALAIVLLVGAGLLIRTLSRLGQTPLGFRPDNVLALRISASWDEKRDMRRVQQRLYHTLEALNGMPGVEAAALSIYLPGGGEDDPQQFGIVGKDSQSVGQQMFADFQSVSPDYFRVLGIPLLAGETCRLTFDDHSTPPVMVNRSLVDRFMGGMNPVQQHVSTGSYSFTISGVVSDVRDHGYAKDPRPTIYFCEMPGFFPDPEFLVRTTADPVTMVESLRRRMQALEPNRGVYDAKPLAAYLSSTLAEKRFQTMLLSLFGGTALLLSIVGLYGVVSFFVSQRSREIGLRAALGAQPRQILAHIFRQGAVMTGAGVVGGLAAAAFLSKSIASLLFGIAPVDPLTFALVPILLALVASVAIWAPARRATKVDPMEALRQE
ncbi:MAG TPA: ABC transporter permease [Bryobacteraceae bacterium]|nr:ABC transporter permease [Bryobacteraceae bacterium]